MSIFGRVGALLRSELTARLGVRRWANWGRRPRRSESNRDEGRTARDGARPRPEAWTTGDRGVPSQDPELSRYYANLELPYGADVDAVGEARRRLLKRYHPDLHSADPGKQQTATRLAQGLNRAHDELVSRLDRK